MTFSAHFSSYCFFITGSNGWFGGYDGRYEWDQWGLGKELWVSPLLPHYHHHHHHHHHVIIEVEQAPYPCHLIVPLFSFHTYIHAYIHTHIHTYIHTYIHSVSDDIDEADLDAELAGLEDELEGLEVEEGAAAEADSTPAYLQPSKSSCIILCPLPTYLPTLHALCMLIMHQ